MPKVQAQKTLQMVEAFLLASPAHSNDELNSKNRHLGQLQREASGGADERPKLSLTQFAVLVGEFGLEVEIIEGQTV